MLKLAISGTRHAHVTSLIKKVRAHDEFELVGIAEPEPDTYPLILEKGGVDPTHSALDAMLDDVEFDVLGVGEIYADRGAVVAKALRNGKHVISDKPICVELAELDEIERLVEQTGLSCLAMLSLRYQATWAAARQALLDGAIGELATVSVFGRHKLDYQNGREGWYFEEGKHGGTLNDLGIHGLDGLEWLTGVKVVETVAARGWNQQLKSVPFFQDGAQAMFRMENGAGVLMDVSYTTPPGHKDRWMFHFNGTEGDLSLNSAGPVVLRRADEPPRELELPPAPERNILDDLISEIENDRTRAILSTAESLRANRLALMAQKTADES